MEPSFWSWEKPASSRVPAIPASSRNGAQLLELGKARHAQLSSRREDNPQWSPAFGAGKSRAASVWSLMRQPSPAMEPSFWSWEKHPELRIAWDSPGPAMEPSFWSWEKRSHRLGIEPVPPRNGAQLLELGKGAGFPWRLVPVWDPQWSPAFGAGKSPPRIDFLCLLYVPRNGAQLLELGKGPTSTLDLMVKEPAMEPSFWSWEKPAWMRFLYRRKAIPQWSPAFGAGKSPGLGPGTPGQGSPRNGAQLLELGKELAIFSPTDYQCCTSLRAAEVLGQTSRVVAP